MRGPFTPTMLNVIADEYDASALTETDPEAANIYRRFAESCRMESRTGQVTCVCHLRPVEQCPAYRTFKVTETCG